MYDILYTMVPGSYHIIIRYFTGSRSGSGSGGGRGEEKKFCWLQGESELEWFVVPFEIELCTPY